jgi:WD40 repeat protein
MISAGCQDTARTEDVPRTENVPQTDDVPNKLGQVTVVAKVPVRIHILAVSLDEECLAVGGNDGKVYLYSLPSGKPLGTLLGPQDETYGDMAVEGLDFSPDGKYLLLGSVTTMWQLWDWQKQKKVREGIADQQADFVVFSNDGKQFATTDKHFQVQLFDTSKGKSLRHLAGPKSWVRDALFTPDGKYLVAAGADGIVFRWTVNSGDLRATPKPNPHENIYGMALSPRGKTLVTIGDKIHLWSMPTLRKEQTFKGDLANGYFAAYTRDGKSLLTAGPAVVLWDANSGKLLDSHKEKEPFWGGLVVTRQHGILAGTKDGRVLRFKVK